MREINNSWISATPTYQLSTPRPAPATLETETVPLSTSSHSGSLSALARQLEACSARAITRAQSLSSTQLGELAIRLQKQLDGAHYLAAKHVHDAEVPRLDSQEARYRALQATAFSNGKSHNPFEKLTREQLSLITYDDQQTFTVNQRRAAWQQIQLTEQLFHHALLRDAEQEYSQHGTLAQAAQKILGHIENLPPIDKARYGELYREQLTQLADKAKPQQPPAGQQPAIWIKSLLIPDADRPANSRLVGALTRHDAGHALLLARLYEGVEPPLRDGASGMSLSNMSLPGTDFLTRQDRNLLSHIYAFAQQQGADLWYVDGLAAALGDYRQHDDGSVFSNMNHGNSYNSEKYQLSVRFIPEVATIAQRLVSGEAFKSTLLDQGFLRFMADPGFKPYGNRCDLQFLEQIMVGFSSASGDSHTLDSRFATPPGNKLIDRIVSAAKDVRLVMKEPIATHADGKWTITATGRAEGYVLDPSSGSPIKKAKTEARPETATALGKTSKGHPLDGFFDRPGVKRLLPTSLLHLLMKYKLQGQVRRP